MSEQACCGGPERAVPECCGSDRSEVPASPCCCASPAGTADYLYGPETYVIGRLQTSGGSVPRVGSVLTPADRRGAWRVRWGIRRADYRVRPGLYALGTPDAQAPVLVTANYKLSFDALRSSLPGVDAWLLVVDTLGINVWCAAGKGTFSAEEVARRAADVHLDDVVAHRRLILPQLAAPGVAAHRVKELCGFRAIFGPVRAADLPAFLAAGSKADRPMRTVTFSLRERLVLTPVELSALWDRRTVLACAGIVAACSLDAGGISLRHGLRRGLPVAGAGALGVLAGGGLTPALLPWLPGRAFAFKGATTGAVAAAAAIAASSHRLSAPEKVALAAGVPALASYAAMNFTGSTPFTSPSGVEREMRRALPLQAAGALIAAGSWLLGRLGR